MVNKWTVLLCVLTIIGIIIYEIWSRKGTSGMLNTQYEQKGGNYYD